MSVQFEPLSPSIGVVVKGITGVECTDEERDLLYKAYLEHGLLLFPGLALTPEEHVRFSHIFGATELHPIEAIRHPECPDLIVLAANSNVDIPAGDPLGEEIVGQIPWHTDLTYTETPSVGALLAAVEVPDEGGLTGWIDTAAVYDALPEKLKQRISGLQVEHDFNAHQKENRSRAGNKAGKLQETLAFPPVTHPLVGIHSETGRKTLNISPFFTARILGLPNEEGAALLKELKDFSTQEHLAYVHDWNVGDMVLWDNRRTMHWASGHPRKFRRVMHRSTLKT